jgi:hypothetical protein
VLRLNVSSNATIFRNASALVVSVPKSGRTWVRVLLHHYLCELMQKPFVLDGEELQRQGLPNLICTHDLWEHRTTRRIKDRLRGKHLVPEGICRRKPILVLARDPRDVVVSLYFQLTKRTMKYRGTLPDMIRDRRFGIDNLVDVMNSWLGSWGQRSNFRLVRYEDCRAEPLEVFGGLIRFIGFALDIDKLLRSIDFASFDNMKRMESEGRFESGILRPKDPGDVESFKVRRGVIGGYRDYLTDEDIAHVETALRKLDTRFGYGNLPDP